MILMHYGSSMKDTFVEKRLGYRRAAKRLSGDSVK